MACFLMSKIIGKWNIMAICYSESFFLCTEKGCVCAVDFLLAVYMLRSDMFLIFIYIYLNYYEMAYVWVSWLACTYPLTYVWIGLCSLKTHISQCCSSITIKRVMHASDVDRIDFARNWFLKPIGRVSVASSASLVLWVNHFRALCSLIYLCVWHSVMYECDRDPYSCDDTNIDSSQNAHLCPAQTKHSAQFGNEKRL